MPVPKPDRPFEVTFPRPGLLPRSLTPKEVDYIEQQLRKVERQDRTTGLRLPKRLQDRNRIRREIDKLERLIDSGAKERELYDAIVNLQILRHALRDMESRRQARERVVFRFNARIAQWQSTTLVRW